MPGKGKACVAAFREFLLGHGGDGRVTVAEVKRYLDREMTYAARRAFGRNQTASVIGDDGRVVAVVEKRVVAVVEK